MKCDWKAIVLPAALALIIWAPSAAAATRPQLTVIQLTEATCAGGGQYYPSIDGAGQKIAFSSQCDLVPGSNLDGNSEIFLMNADGTGLKQLTFSSGGLGSYEPAISANGEKVVFVSDRDLVSGNNADFNAEIFTVNADASGITQVTHSTGGDPNNFGGNSHPRFDPRTRRIAFSSDRDLIPGSNSDGNHELFLVYTDGSGLLQLTHTTGGYGVFDPGGLDSTGARIIFDSDRDMIAGGNADGNFELFMMNINGTGLVQLTHTTGGQGCTGPIWTPNGQIVTFWSDRDLVGNNPDGDYEVFRMNIDGSGLVQVTAGTGGFGSAPWGITSDGGTMAVESDRDLVPGSNAALTGQIYLVKLRP